MITLIRNIQGNFVISVFAGNKLILFIKMLHLLRNITLNERKMHAIIVSILQKVVETDWNIVETVYNIILVCTIDTGTIANVYFYCRAYDITELFMNI